MMLSQRRGESRQHLACGVKGVTVSLQSTRSRILVVSLGGTIASTSSEAGGVVPQLSAQDLIAAVPELEDVAEVSAVSFRQVPSGDLTLGDVAALSRIISEHVAGGVDGVVVTQGTDTIEETSFALDVVGDSTVPVVVTGAMRNPTTASPDGRANLLAAVRVASSPLARGLGCLVVMNDEVHAARFVRKMHSSSVAAFASPTAGALGWLSEGRVRIAMRCRPLARISAGEGEPPPVALVSCFLGDDGRSLSSLAALGYRGVVLEGLGAGHVPRAMVTPLEELAATMPVILCSRTGAGDVLRDTYGFVGSESDLLARGLVWGGALDGRKSRVAMSLALGASSDSSSAVAHFARVRDSVTEYWG